MTFEKLNEPWNKGKKGLQVAWNKKNLNEVEILELYLNKSLSAREIGRKLNYGAKCIYRVLRENNIKLRPSSYYKKGKPSWNKGLAHKEDLRVLCGPMLKSTKEKLSKKMKRFPLNKQELEKLYLNKKISSLKIAKQIGVAKKTVLFWLKKYDIKIRTTSESLKGNICMENHPNWLGGKSFEPYGIEFNKALKRLIRKRDNQICMACLIHKEKLKRTLNIHHINYDKKCNFPQNLISLCGSCHAKTNFNREHWIKFFQSLLSNKYAYDYNYNSEIVLEVVNDK